MPFHRILIANRGEIALRIVRTLKELGITSIVVYTPDDLMSPAAELADEAYALPSGATYTSADVLVRLAQELRADAVHPGYGFLSEDAEFAQELIDRGITWIGPTPQAMTALGDKLSARLTASRAGVHPVPGISSPITSRHEVTDFAHQYGYPVALKRTDGGGGRGITVLASDDDVMATPALGEHQGTTPGQRASANGPAPQILEKFIARARHIETQCARDAHGKFAVISTRDCSLQRRHQKLLEEAPAPFIPSHIEEQLIHDSQALFDYVNYVGVGTCEFLYTDTGDLWFLEVNPRLQVEHCVSEEVTGLDLVALQIAIAAHQDLPVIPDVHGHSIELRITSEDPAHGLLPSTGTITSLHWPEGHGVRVESGVREGDTVTALFDPMLAKLIITAPTRKQALARAQRVLKETHFSGLRTCLPFHEFLINHPKVTDADDQAFYSISTRWIEEVGLPEFLDSQQTLSVSSGLQAPSVPNEVVDSPRTRSTYVIELNGRRVQLTLPDGILAGGGTRRGVSARRMQPLRGRSSAVARTRQTEVNADSHTIVSPMQAIVTRICVEPGSQVSEGDLLVVLESMKMENYVHAPADCTIKSICVCAGATVSNGDVLVRLESQESE
ncbi:acetyl/propionyl/methylcrotonyl-CoA carboxylase subunit alpha [Actinomyces vulturis]|uniref:acetyl/propionyl/methylcrotonyl-CoA carboxylase subunit alpha n=1 Tax=Actinomyces vulturis TaxID=1857645 RepID=UPI00082F8FC5|nr:biotin carboxylase N-terminal domain-containing protein [Actinomyces vulturis]